MSSLPIANQGAAEKIQKVTKTTTGAKKKTRRTQKDDGPYHSPVRPRGRPRIYDTRSTTNSVLEGSNGSPGLSSATQSVAEGADARTSRSDIFSCTSMTAPPNSLSTANDAYGCFSFPATGITNTPPSTTKTSETTSAGFKDHHPPPIAEFPSGILDFNGVQDDNILLERAFLEEGNTQRLDDTANVNEILEATWNPALSGSGHEAIAPTDLQHGFTAARPVPLTPTVGGRPGPSPLSAPADLFSTHHLPYNDMCSHRLCPGGCQPTFNVGPRMSVQSSCGMAAGAFSPPQYQIPPAGMEAQWSLVPLTAFSLVRVNVANNGNPKLYHG